MEIKMDPINLINFQLQRNATDKFVTDQFEKYVRSNLRMQGDEVVESYEVQAYNFDIPGSAAIAISWVADYKYGEAQRGVELINLAEFCNL